MSNIIAFRPREGVEAQAQLREFIAWAKGLSGFDKPDLPLDWGAWSWKIWFGRSLDFVKLSVNSRSSEFDSESDLLDPEIIDFAKAYVLHQQSLNATKNVQEIVAVRVLEAALLELESIADVTRANLNVYDRAGELIKELYAPAAAYRIGGHLQKLSEFIAEKDLSESGDRWVSFIRRPNDAHGHIKNKEESKKKMPTEAALNAIAEIWSAQPTDHRDIYVTSNCALLLSSPGRVGELNLLAVDALTYKENREGKSELFINWYGQKGFGFTDKAVPEVWKEFTEESFRRLKEITEEPRKLAKILEENPDEFPMHERCPKVRQDVALMPNQVLEAMCIGAGKSGRRELISWLKSNIGILSKSPLYSDSKTILREQLDNMYEGRAGEGKVDVYTLTLRKLNVFVRECWLPPHFPYTDESKKMKYQHALNCYFEGQMHAGGAGFIKRFSLQNINKSFLNNSLSLTSGKGNKNRQNIFLRWGYKGAEYSLTTHQFRHYLNTLAAKGRVGEVEIARWSGRMDVSQNKVYNHISDEEHVDNVRAIGLGSQATNLATVSSKQQPILLKDLGLVGEDGDRVAHYSEYGVCVHDFAAEPCPKYRDCLTCKEHKCIKGDLEKERRVKLLRDGLEQTVKQAQSGVEQEFYGADRWLMYSMDRLEKANELIQILEDPDVPEGAVITCSDNGYSALEKGLAAHGRLSEKAGLAIESDKPKAQVEMEKLRGLMGR